MLGTIIVIVIVVAIVGLLYWSISSFFVGINNGQVFTGKVIGFTEEQSGYASHTACVVFYNNHRYSVDVLGGGGCTYLIGENIPFKILDNDYGFQAQGVR